MLEFDPPEEGDVIAVQHLPDGARFGKATTLLPSLEVIAYQRLIDELRLALDASLAREAALREQLDPKHPSENA